MQFYAFGESYGGAYVISLAHVYLQYRENDPSSVSNLNFVGIGIGNGFVSAEHQSKYADYVRLKSNENSSTIVPFLHAVKSF